MPLTPARRRLLASAGALLLTVLALPSATLAGPPVPSPTRLPDLRMLKPKELRIVEPTAALPRKLLRFTSTFVNMGDGPFEVRGQRSCISMVACPRMAVRQRFLREDGTWYNQVTTARMKMEVGDHHDHWHVIGMERFELFDMTQPRGGTPLRGQKFGYCFFDVRPFDLSLPGAPGGQRYVESGELPNNGCGGRGDLVTRMGLSVGWQDIYPWDFAGQWIDITDVPDGEYLVCVTADPVDRFRELKERNNQSWVKIAITGATVGIVSSGRLPCAWYLPPAEEEPDP